MDQGNDHGGDLAQAMGLFGGTTADWIDLSTGINRVPYPAAPASAAALRDLPGRAARDRLIGAAQAAYATDWPVLPLAGAQAAIQLVPAIAPPGPVRIVAPTYNEHAGVLRTAGRDVQAVEEAQALAGAALGIVVNPNNPDGQRWAPDTLRGLADRVGLLVVDESFADPHPELSVLGGPCPDNVLVLRSFGKFYGLAGLRLGFALGSRALLDRMAARAGPWPVCGPAIEAGTQALADAEWRADSIARLADDAARADALAAAAGWPLVGGTALFRLYDTGDAPAARARLARHHIWTRIFPYSAKWLRLGLPGTPAEWARLAAALRA
ncbi:threonine-phosphate decarboxylase CobD [Rhodovulum adriaticum]|uniref:threonine-phosphate decarboxylase n=1 Tax=Rhodovulum adriaticum TaxID=35804 RepID=A0A4R2NMI4_RHOAD|nr:threonine-phosphate decarboxylase CobD [Rhodovulum adriaticum]MBK1636338.1 threonine-phosphate decarboxylase [Rhodovulum adriaticum]TCP22827.1 L-threonine O-3-phosphate decarboxylase [Rhodovulum adriaticum]